jgi:hypothetical protein
MASLTPKQRAHYMSETGLSEKAIAGILGIDLADVQALMVEAEPDVELPGGAGGPALAVGEVQVDLPFDQATDGGAETASELVTLEIEAGSHLVFVGYRADIQPDDMSATAYLQVEGHAGNWPVTTFNGTNTSVLIIGQASDVDLQTVFALVTVEEASELAFYAYGPSANDIVTFTDVFIHALKVA